MPQDGPAGAGASPPPGLVQLLTGFWVSQALYVAAKLGIADVVRAGPRTAGEIAAAVAADEAALRRLLRALTPRVIDFVRCELDNLRACRAPARVPCHGDFSPRNWLVSDGDLHLIDFGEAGPNVWVSDLGRLIFGWRLPADSLGALLEGYGRQPDSAELVLLRATYAAAVVLHIVLGHEHGNRDFEASSRQLLDAMISRELT